MKGLNANLDNITYVQLECSSFFEATPEAAESFAKVINEVCAKGSFEKIEVTLEHRGEMRWKKTVRIDATFTRKDKSHYSYGCTYWSKFSPLP